MSYPVFMARTDVSGLQPSYSSIITATQAGGLGYLILRRWRGITCHWLAREIGQQPPPPLAGNRSMPVRKGVPPFASIGVRSRPPPPCLRVRLPPSRHGTGAEMTCRPGGSSNASPPFSGLRCFTPARAANGLPPQVTGDPVLVGMSTRAVVFGGISNS